MDIISTSDGRISFKADDYVSHKVGSEGGLILKENEIVVFTKKGTAFERGEIIPYSSHSQALYYSKEIIKQLLK